MPKKKENTLIQIFTTTSKIGLMTIVFGASRIWVEIVPIWQQPESWDWHLIMSLIILENQYRVGDIVNFDNAGGTVQEISLRKLL
jgi:small conductance mechanosensitive channel